ncbi:Outer membrane protein transport protein (OMPP1/FadL/TodX) [Spongiibacter sp. IMCC21906]|uniref:OmpP1/FadL family transporter n=1 Tax=Spongiibacter sp. IMCC21906 TaxID=1620392 RepID=UPI00062DF249|nr:outer membrane protein transport protein [Spongiibacter sp. IMCC21906]AKH68412.1 Outer membrane protein transport protein (OMPP1/FadL/TodX) [Spongiibacter sp. IMCC21906]
MRLKRLSLQTLFASGLIAFSLAGHSVETARIEGFGPVARGLAGAGVAHNTGAAAIILNPAELLSQKPGHELMLQISEIHVNIDIRNLDTHEFARNSHQRNNRGPYDLPEIAYSYRTENWAFGIGAFAAAGFGTEYRDRTFLSRTSTGNVETGLDTTSRIFALKIPLALAWQATDTLKFGAAVDIVRVGLNVATLYDVQQIRMLSNQGRVGGGLAALTALPTLAGVHLDFVKEDPLDSELQAWGIGGRLGLSWQATAKTNLAISYDFETHIADLRGKGKLTAIDILNTQIQLNGSGRFQDLQLPASITAGFSHAFSSKFSLVGDIRCLSA